MFPPREKQGEIWAQVAFYTSLGFIMPAGAVGGYVLGWLLDRWLGTKPLLSIIVGFLGAAGGLVEVLKILTGAENHGNKPEAGPKP